MCVCVVVRWRFWLVLLLVLVGWLVYCVVCVNVFFGLCVGVVRVSWVVCWLWVMRELGWYWLVLGCGLVCWYWCLIGIVFCVVFCGCVVFFVCIGVLWFVVWVLVWWFFLGWYFVVGWWVVVWYWWGVVWVVFFFVGSLFWFCVVGVWLLWMVGWIGCGSVCWLVCWCLIGCLVCWLLVCCCWFRVVVCVGWRSFVFGFICDCWVGWYWLWWWYWCCVFFLGFCDVFRCFLWRYFLLVFGYGWWEYVVGCLGVVCVLDCWGYVVGWSVRYWMVLFGLSFVVKGWSWCLFWGVFWGCWVLLGLGFLSW